jgi:hypothetical protein
MGALGGHPSAQDPESERHRERGAAHRRDLQGGHRDRDGQREQPGRRAWPEPVAQQGDPDDLDGYVYDALRAGAAGFLLKATPPDRLVAGIETVAAGSRCSRRR